MSRRAANQRRATRPTWITKGDDFYEISQIVGHGVIDDSDGSDPSKILYEVIWKGYPERTYEPAENFKGAVKMLKEYQTWAKIPLITMVNVVGAAPNMAISYNTSLWIEVDRVVQMIKFKKAIYFDGPILVSSLPLDDKDDTLLGSSDAVYIHGQDKHCYAILYIAQER